MDYIGIAAWREKLTLLKSEHFDRCSVATKALTLDCERHLDFLDAYLDKNKNFSPRDTLYYAYYKFFAGESIAIEKCKKFAFQIDRSLVSKPDLAEEYIDVTDDGIRLDGSHRASIALAIGIEQLPVRVFRWKSLFPENRISHIRKELALKRDARSTFQPSKVFESDSGNYLGELIYKDYSSNITAVQQWRLPNIFVSYKPILAIKSQKQVFYRSAQKLFSCPIDQIS